MGLFDSLINQTTNSLKRSVKAKATQALNSATNKAGNQIAAAVTSKKETFTFTAIPQTLEEMKALKEAELKTPYQTVALTLLALCLYEKDQKTMFEMLDFLNGPDEVSNYTKQFIIARLTDRTYLPFSFFAGATVKNGYTPTVPYEITVSSNSYSFKEENWATLHVTSSGADSPRGIVLRKKPSTGEWFVNDIQCLSEIRIPDAENPWA